MGIKKAFATVSIAALSIVSMGSAPAAAPGNPSVGSPYKKEMKAKDIIKAAKLSNVVNYEFGRTKIGEADITEYSKFQSTEFKKSAEKQLGVELEGYKVLSDDARSSEGFSSATGGKMVTVVSKAEVNGFIIEIVDKLDHGMSDAAFIKQYGEDELRKFGINDLDSRSLTVTDKRTGQKVYAVEAKYVGDAQYAMICFLPSNQALVKDLRNVPNRIQEVLYVQLALVNNPADFIQKETRDMEITARNDRTGGQKVGIDAMRGPNGR